MASLGSPSRAPGQRGLRACLRRAAGIGLALALLVALSALVLILLQERSWEQSRASADRAFDRWAALPTQREALWGETAEGSAFESYDALRSTLLGTGAGGAARPSRAIHLLWATGERPLDAVWTELGAPVPDASVGGDALRRAMLKTPGVRSVLVALREGAHRRLVQHGLGSPGRGGDWVKRSVHRSLLCLVRAHAAEVAEAGDPVDAARWLLDLAQLGLDLAGSPHSMDQSQGQFLATAVFGGATSRFEEVEGLGRSGRRECLRYLPEIIRRLESKGPHLDAAEVISFRYLEWLLTRPELVPEDVFFKARYSAMKAALCRRGCEEVRQGFARGRAYGAAAAARWALEFPEWGGYVFDSLHQVSHDRLTRLDSLRAFKAELELDLNGVPRPTLHSRGEASAAPR